MSHQYKAGDVINSNAKSFVECDRMMALIPRKTIYLFDVCLVAMFV